VASLIKEYSRLKYGRKREFVDQEIAARIGIDLEAKMEEVKDKAFAPLPDEMEKKPIAGAEVEKITPEKVAEVEKAHVEQAVTEDNSVKAS
jgi:hypothetical protein